MSEITLSRNARMLFAQAAGTAALTGLLSNPTPRSFRA